MATKQEILDRIKASKERTTSIAAFYTFDEGSQIFLDRPEQDLEKIDSLIIQHLVNGITDENSFELASLLYYRTFASLPKEQFDAITGSVYIDRNLFSEATQDTAKTGASAAFTPSTNDVFLREDFLSGGPRTQANDIVSILHETKHYFQYITSPMFIRHMGKEDEGSLSRHDLLVNAFKGFGPKTLFPDISEKEIGEYSYAIYHQNPIEKEAREYSLQIAHELISKALETENLPEEKADYLNALLSKVNSLRLQEVVDNIKNERIYSTITTAVEAHAEEILSKKEEVLSPENISKLEHYDENDKETEATRQFLFDVENALFVKYDEDAAYIVEDVVLNYDVFAVGRRLVQNPNYHPQQQFIDNIIKDNVFIEVGMNPIPCYPMDEVVGRYAEINADPVQ